MKPSHQSISDNFSLREARTAIQQYMAPNPVIYWCDFLVSIMLGHICFGVARTLTGDLYLADFAPAGGWKSPIQPYLPTDLLAAHILHVICSIGACLLFYRSAMFIHELVHLRRGTFKAFRAVWNLLCGVPFLMPSFVYHTHVDHHRREHYGTEQDGEYFPFSHQRPWTMVAWLLHPFIVPPMAVLRFAILTPMAWLLPPLKRLVHQRASSLIIDPAYIRPLPSTSVQRTIYLQEFLCLLWCLFIPYFSVRAFGGLLPFLVQAYCTGVVLLLINGLRTLGAHRWVNNGSRMTFTEQLLDSVNYPDRPWVTGLWGPVGLRYHALHHLFPTLPYHNFPAAHRALLASLPADSPYRQTSATSLSGALIQLWKRAAATSCQSTDGPSSAVSQS